MNVFFRVLSSITVLLSSALCFSQEVAPAAISVAQPTVLYQCWIPAVPGAFDQPEFAFDFKERTDEGNVVSKEVSIELRSTSNIEPISTEKVISHRQRKVNRLGKTFPLTAAVIEEKVRTTSFSYVVMIPASDDGVYFKDEQGENEPVPFEEEVKPTDILAPGSVSFKVPDADEEGGFYTETWALVCQVPNVYRDRSVEELDKESLKSFSPMDIYQLLRGLLKAAAQLQVPKN